MVCHELTPGQQLADFYSSLHFENSLPEGVEIMNPYRKEEVRRVVSSFFSSFYSDSEPRNYCIGINPGRFGAGITGICFTDPVHLKEKCGIEHQLSGKTEVSSRFIYAAAEYCGGVNSFFSNVYLTAVCPLGFVRDGVNLNYYDIPELPGKIEEFVIESMRRQLGILPAREVAYSLGKGKNIKYLKQWNKRYGFFNQVEALPHPRWVMQYNYKNRELYMDQYRKALVRQQ